MYEESAISPRIMSMGVHPYIMGVPHRIKYFEAAFDHILKQKDVWFATADEIYDWYKRQQA
jgi:allantoinase